MKNLQIYHCMRKSTVKEILHKAGLDELGVFIKDLDEANWIRSYCARHKNGYSKFKFNREVDELC